VRHALLFGMVTRRAYVSSRNVKKQRGYFIAEFLIVLGIMSLITLMAVIGTPELFKSKRPYAKVRPVGAVRKVNASGGSDRSNYARDWAPVSPGSLSGVESCTPTADKACPPNSLQPVSKANLSSVGMATTQHPQ